jgi:hypothetical protein
MLWFFALAGSKVRVDMRHGGQRFGSAMSPT